MSLEASSPDTEPERSYRFADMRLQPGDRLQVHCPTHPDRARHICRFIGHVDDASLLVTVPSPHGIRAPFIENEIVVVQAFSRNSAFAFKASILKMSKLPYDYMHLSFPERIQGSTVRKSTRVRVNLSSQVTTSGGQVPAALVDLSATGLRIRSEIPLGERGESIRVAFRVTLHDVDTDINAQAVILSANDGEPGSHLYGVEFRELSSQDGLILRSLIYQQMIENPRSMA